MQDTDDTATATPLPRTAPLWRWPPTCPARAVRPGLGSALKVEPARFHLQLEDWCREFGPYFSSKLAGRRILVVGDHEAVAGVLRDRPEGFARTSRLEGDLIEMGFAPGVFGANGENHSASGAW